MRRALQRALSTDPHRYPPYETFSTAQGRCNLYLVVAWSSVVMAMAFGALLWRLKVKIAPPSGPTEEPKSRIVEVSEEELKQLAAGRDGNS